LRQLPRPPRATRALRRHPVSSALRGCEGGGVGKKPLRDVR
jgi:hypothetical protein